MASSWPPMNERGPQVTEAQIEAFERSYGHRLPDDYRQFLLDVNGGQPDKAHCDFDQGVVNCLFSLDDTENDSCELATRAKRARASLPSPDLLFIGHDDGGARILLALAGEHRGEVWFMLTGDDARPDDANPRVLWHDRRDMQKLADSFEQFMRSLQPLQLFS
jgi:SMI1 / KNR4 family (SUKH-1)